MLSIAVFQPDIPQNLGNIIRTSFCMNVELEIIAPCIFPLNEKNLKRVSVGFFNQCKIKIHQSWSEFKVDVIKRKKRIIIFSPYGKKVYTDFEFKTDDILLFGRESEGFPQYVYDEIENSVFIPMKEKNQSLNVAVSVGIGIAEAIRQTT